MEQIRTADDADVAAMAAMAQIRREQYARYQPLFWRPAEGAQDKHRPYLARLVGDETIITLVSEDAGALTGFLIATLTGAPGVYDPGGATCQIDDFVVVPAGRWQETGARLLRAGLAEAAGAAPSRRSSSQRTSTSPSARCSARAASSPLLSGG